MKLETTINLKDIVNKLNQLQHGTSNLSPVFAEIANELENRTTESFEKQESAHDGTPWQQLKPATTERKKGRGRILHDQGDLEDSVASDYNSNHASVGTNAVTIDGYPYPAVHQFGSEKKRVPARPFLPFDTNGEISDDLHDTIVQTIEEHLKNTVK